MSLVSEAALLDPSQLLVIRAILLRQTVAEMEGGGGGGGLIVMCRSWKMIFRKEP